MVGAWLKGSPCLQRADEGHTIVNALGRTSYTPQPQGPPEGFRRPNPMPWAGFSWARRRGSAPPRHLPLGTRPAPPLPQGGSDVDRGRSREAPRGVARMAPGSREKLAGARL